MSSQHRSLSNFADGSACSDHVAVLSHPSQSAEVGYAFGKYLAKAAVSRKHGWETLLVDGVNEGEPSMVALARGLRDQGVMVHGQSKFRSWFRPCASSWDQYLRSLSSQGRRHLDRLLDRCDETGPLTLELAATREEAYRYLDRAFDMQRERCNVAGRSSVFCDPALRQFIRDAVDGFFQQDRIHLAILRDADAAVAAAVYIEGGDQRLYCYTTAYDRAYATLQPGLVLNAAMLRKFHQQQYEGVEFLRGDDPLKVRLRAKPTRSFSLRAVTPSLLPRIRHAAWITGFELKQLVRRHVGLRPVPVLDIASQR